MPMANKDSAIMICTCLQACTRFRKMYFRTHGPSSRVGRSLPTLSLVQNSTEIHRDEDMSGRMTETSFTMKKNADEKMKASSVLV